LAQVIRTSCTKLGTFLIAPLGYVGREDHWPLQIGKTTDPKAITVPDLPVLTLLIEHLHCAARVIYGFSASDIKLLTIFTSKFAVIERAERECFSRWPTLQNRLEDNLVLRIRFQGTPVFGQQTADAAKHKTPNCRMPAGIQTDERTNSAIVAEGRKKVGMDPAASY
jgi:hypothetical protein